MIKLLSKPKRMVLWNWLTILILTCWSTFSLETNQRQSHHVINKSKLYWLREAVKFIEEVQSNCSSMDYIRVRIGINGGFAAQFQYMASEFSKAFAAGDFRTPVIVYGHINGYSEGEECKHVNHEWICFFQPSTMCEKQLLSQSTEKHLPGLPKGIDHSIPTNFQHLGIAFWWGAIQYYLFRLQPFVVDHILHEAKHVMHPVFTFPFGLPSAGMHVRRGDKHIDGFHTHSFEEEMSLVRNSPDCEVQNSRLECFVFLKLNDSRVVQPQLGVYGYENITNHFTAQNRAIHILNSALMKRTLILRLADMDKFNYSTKNEDIAVNPKRLLTLLRHRHSHSVNSNNHNHHHHPKNVSHIRSSSSSKVIHAFRRYLQSTTHNNINIDKNNSINTVQQRSHIHLHHPNSHNSSNNMMPITAEDQKLLSDVYVIPLAIFVASDDASVVHTAVQHGYFADATGVSQQTASDGMFKTLLSHHEYGFNATLEILTDIFFLAHTSTLLGMAASQVFRMSVALANVTDTLQHVQATDRSQINRIKMLSLRYDVPFVEHFEA